MNIYPYIKALHIIFVVCWFAALFYLPRLLVYHREAQEQDELSRKVLQLQLQIMMRRLWRGIAAPAALLVLISGSTLLLLRRDNLPEWLLVKILLLAILYAFHFFLHHLLQQLNQQTKHPYSSVAYRIINEVPTLLLFGIIFLAITKETHSWLWAVGILALVLAIFFSISRLWKSPKK